MLRHRYKKDVFEIHPKISLWHRCK